MRKGGLTFLAALAVLYAFLWLAAMEPPLEDAFISMHCARNLVQGHGLTFNPAAGRSHEQSALDADARGIGIDPRRLSISLKSSGFLFGLATLCLALAAFAQEFEKLDHSRVRLHITSAFTLFYYLHVYGLESPLQMALFLGLLWGLLERRWILAGTMLGLLPGCRPEGLFFVPLVYLAAGVWDRRQVRWPGFFSPVFC